jgi:hypothetical protein
LIQGGFSTFCAIWSTFRYTKISKSGNEAQTIFWGIVKSGIKTQNVCPIQISPEQS